MGAAVEAHADIALGEAFKPAAVAHARIYRGELKGTLQLAFLFVGGIIVGTAAGTVIAGLYPQWGSWPTSVLSIAGMTAGLYLGLRAYSRQHLTGFLGKLRELGSPATFPTRFLFSDDAIHIDSQRLAHRVAWDAVLFVIPDREHWLLQADTMTLAVPRRAFADAAAEQAFLELAEARLSDEARARSVFKSQ